MSISAINSRPPLPAIADVYELIRGECLDGDGDERRGFCLSVDHADANPSCDYNVAKDTFNCKSCNEAGGVLALPTIAGKSEDRKSAHKWLRENGLVVTQTAASVWASVSVIIYPYRDAKGQLVYEVGRWDKPGGDKLFRQRVPNGKGSYNEGKNSLASVERVPYRLPELLAHVKNTPDAPVFVVEGEKDANNLAEAGATVTTNSQGTKFTWPLAWLEYFRGLSVVYVLADNDEPGRVAALQRGQLLAKIVPEVRVIYALPDVAEKGDVSDWLEKPGSDLAALVKICAEGEVATPYLPAYDADAVAAIVADQTDIGAARWFNHHFSTRARFVIESAKWFIYADGIWKRDDAGKFVIKSLDDLASAARDIGDVTFQKFTESVRSHREQDALLKTAARLNRVSLSMFDTRHELFNCANGTLNLDTGLLQLHNPDDLLTLRTDVVYDAQATCPRFEQWLLECVDGDNALFVYVQQMLGSCLEARPGLRRFYLIFGQSGTGKSSFIQMLEALLGTYRAAASFKVLTEARYSDDGSKASPQIAKLRGMRAVSVAEAKGDARLDVEVIKQMIGGDKMIARFLNENLVEFSFDATLIMTGNEIPRINGDDSIWEKFKPVPFEHKIVVENPNFVRDVLTPELSGILNFALRGLEQLRAVSYNMVEPKVVSSARAKLRLDQDPLIEFAGKFITKTGDPKDEVYADSIWDVYDTWFKGGESKLTKRNLNDSLGKAPHSYASVSGNGNRRKFLGMKLLFTEIQEKTPF